MRRKVADDVSCLKNRKNKRELFTTPKRMSFRNQVLAAFKQLHKTRKVVFEGDTYALKLTQDKINEEFKKNKNETDSDKIKELIKIANDSETILRKNVVQLKLKEDTKDEESQTWEMKIREDTEMYDFTEPWEPPPVNKKQKKCS
ncbi:complex III assembly factor LYRM7 isoform X1 [Lingula anatina]|uniref:Complex III assembly factor LYRM7 n=2 Tax=Lingula anatina TaxID=7574 RepID=A0A1S3JEA1_LINAN|nr:complex III assembly factor LYRM7 isoform X1 [Lingula anatina]|eukprot:XP_013408491.1 complex III assembly factor LYRM7 isoform X1 [Lingula anatina]